MWTWAAGYPTCRKRVAQISPTGPRKPEYGTTQWPLTTFGLKGGVSLLWYKSSQFMGLKNTWFFISSCRKKVLITSSPPHGTPPHPIPWLLMSGSSNSTGSWLLSSKTLTGKVTCNSSWFQGTKGCSAARPLPVTIIYITSSPIAFIHSSTMYWAPTLCQHHGTWWWYVSEQVQNLPLEFPGIFPPHPPASVHLDSSRMQTREIDHICSVRKVTEVKPPPKLQFPGDQNLGLSPGPRSLLLS